MFKVLLIATLLVGLLIVSDARSVGSKNRHGAHNVGPEVTTKAIRYTSPENNFNFRLGEGIFRGFTDALEKVSDWAPSFGANYAALTVDFTLPELRITFDTPSVSFDDLSTSEPFSVSFSDTIFTAQVTATYPQAECKVDLKTASSSMILNPVQGSFLAEILDQNPVVKSEFLGTLASSLKSSLETSVTLFSRPKILEDVNLDSLCKKAFVGNFQAIKEQPHGSASLNAGPPGPTPSPPPPGPPGPPGPPPPPPGPTGTPDPPPPPPPTPDPTGTPPPPPPPPTSPPTPPTAPDPTTNSTTESTSPDTSEAPTTPATSITTDPTTSPNSTTTSAPSTTSPGTTTSPDTTTTSDDTSSPTTTTT